MKLNYLLGAFVLSLFLGACNEQPKTETPVVVETPVEKTEVVKVVVEQPKVETKIVVEKEKIVVEKEKEKETEISIGSKGASLKTKKLDIKISE